MCPNRFSAADAVRILTAVIVLASTLTLSASDFPQARFYNAATNVGDEGEQSIEMKLDMHRDFSQSGTAISTEKLQLRRQQVRQIKVLEVRNDVASRVIVTFLRARQYSNELETKVHEEQLPVDGRAYEVSRIGDELQVLTKDGGEPDDVERDFVVASMAALGRPNLLGRLLDGKTLRKGDTMRVPAELVHEFLANTSAGAATMDLKLVDLKEGSLPRRAIFTATLDTGTAETSELAMKMVGRWEVDVATCQTLSASFQGPVHASERHGPVGAQYEITTHGELDVRVTRAPIRVSR